MCVIASWELYMHVQRMTIGSDSEDVLGNN